MTVILSEAKESFFFLCKIFACQGFKGQIMKKDRIIKMLAIGLLGLLGFSSCSPRLRPRRAADPVDTLKVFPPIDTIIIKTRPDPDAPIKLMYGVPPARFERMEAPEKQLKTE